MHRRAFLVAVGTAMAGCGGSQAGGTPSASPIQTPTASSSPTATPTPINSLRRFREELTARDVTVGRLASGDIRASLTYSVETADTAAVESTIRDVAMAFQVPIEHDWSVEGLNVSVVHRPTGETFATYRIEALWAKQHLEGTIDTARYTGKIVATLDVNPGAVDTPTPTPEPTPADADGPSGVALGAADAQPDDAYASLSVDYNHETVQTIDPPNDDATYDAWTSHKILAVQLRVTNNSDVTFNTYPSAFDVRTADETVKFFQLQDTSNPLDGVSLAAGEQSEGWIPYQLYKDVSEADLVFDQSVYYGSVACDFERDPSLAVRL